MDWTVEFDPGWERGHMSGRKGAKAQGGGIIYNIRIGASNCSTEQ